MADTSALRSPHAATQLPAACCQVSATLQHLAASKVTPATPDVNAQCSLRLGASPFFPLVPLAYSESFGRAGWEPAAVEEKGPSGRRASWLSEPWTIVGEIAGNRKKWQIRALFPSCQAF